MSNVESNTAGSPINPPNSTRNIKIAVIMIFFGLLGAGSFLCIYYTAFNDPMIEASCKATDCQFADHMITNTFMFQYYYILNVTLIIDNNFNGYSKTCIYNLNESVNNCNRIIGVEVPCYYQESNIKSLEIDYDIFNDNIDHFATTPTWLVILISIPIGILFASCCGLIADCSIKK